MDKETRERLQELTHTANALSLMVSTEGWEILLDTFEQKKQDQLDELSKFAPGDEKSILAAHAVWYSVVHTLDDIIYSVQTAINEGRNAQNILNVDEDIDETDPSI